MSQSKLFSYFGKKRKEIEVENQNISESATNSISMAEQPHTSKKLKEGNGSEFFTNTNEPCQPLLETYPKRLFGSKQRSFYSDWYNKYKWLEYSEELDACFCFPCRVFLPYTKEKTFTKTGFRNWKHACESGKGFDQHSQSPDHTSAMILWVDRDKRDVTNNTVKDIVVQPTSEQRQWLFTVFHVVRYLSANELPLRGDTETDIITGDGLFLRTFSQLLFPLDPKLIDIHTRLPVNAKYTSHDIQDEVIEELASLTQEKISDEIKEAKLFTIMADGTTDKNRKEVQGLVCRYWSPGGNVKEHCLNIEGVDERSAKGIFGFIKKTLDKFGIGMDGLVSQSYDGASVMSGDRNGLKILISEECQRYVLYIHCFLHRVSLVVVHAMENISDIKEYFDIISSLYQFFKKSAVLNMYEGTQLKRLIATRWSGHFDSTNHVNKNYGQILKALHLACKNKKLKSEERALAIGLVNQMGGEGDEVFIFINCLLMEILTPINIVVKTLQSSQENLHSAIQVVNAVREDLKSTRSLLNDVFIEKMISDFKEKNQITVERSKEKRSKSVPAHFQDFVITDPIPADSNYSNNAQTFKECLDLIETEFERRFSNDDVTLWHSMESLSPKFEKFLDADLLNPLFEYAKTIPVIQREYSRLNVSVEDLKGECRIFSRVLKNKEFTKDGNGVVDLVDFASHIIEKYVESAPILCSLYRVAITAGFSSTRVECLFSSLTRVDSPQRRSMLTKRECQLAYLAFESKTLLDISFDTFLHAWKTKPRKLTDI